MTPDKVEEFAKELSAKVRWSSGYGQYENDSKEQQAYVDGVTTAIGMMYIDLTGTPKSKGMLGEHHQDLMSDLVERLEEMKYKGEPSADASDLTWAGHHEHNNTLTEAQTIIKSK